MASRTRSSVLTLLLAVCPLVACGDAPPPAKTPAPATTASSVATASSVSSAATTGGAASNDTPPPVAGTADPGDLDYEHLLHVADADDTPEAIARRYGPAKLTPEQRWTALGEIGRKFRETVRDAASLATFVTWVKTRPEVEAAGTRGLTAWGRFTDGRIFAFLATPADAPARLQRGELPADRGGSRSAKSLPTSKTVIGIDTVGVMPEENAKTVKWMGDVGHEGKAYDGSANVTVSFLATAVAGQALLNWNSHGGFGQERDEHEEYVLQSATPVRDCAGNKLVLSKMDAFVKASKCPDADYEPYFAKGELAYTAATIYQNGRIEESRMDDVWTYGLTHRFVENHFKLAKHAVVVIDACQSGTPAAAAMRGAFLKANAEVVLAWGDDVLPNEGVRTAKAFWLSMLGALANEPAYDQTPRARPWDLEGTMALLHQWKWDETKVDGKLALFRPSPRNAKAMAVASIKSVEIDEMNQRATLTGDFGDDKPSNAKVTVGGADCPVTSFAKDKVECDLGADFKTGDGVFVADGRKSNAVPLTGWKIQGDYVVKFPPTGGGGFGQSWHIDAQIRADVHKHRDVSLDTAGKLRDPFAVTGAHTSSCTPVGSGFKSMGVGGQVAGSAGAAVKATFGRPDPAGTCIIAGKLDPGAKTLALGFLAMGGAGGITISAPTQTVRMPTPPAMLLDEMKDTTVSVPTFGPGAGGQTLNGATFAFDDAWTLGARKTASKKMGPGGEMHFELKATAPEKNTAPTDKTVQ